MLRKHDCVCACSPPEIISLQLQKTEIHSVTCRYMWHIPPLRQNSCNSMKQALLQAWNWAVLLFFIKSILYVRKKKENHHISLVSFLPPPLLKETHHTRIVLLQVHGQTLLDASHGYGNALLRLYDPYHLRCWWLYQIYAPFTELFRNGG